MKNLKDRIDRHDYEPGDYGHPGEAEPLCRICGQYKSHPNHGAQS